jgi:hypothetical protein
MMKNEHGYDHEAAIKPNTPTAYKLVFADGREGGECCQEGSELYREGWQHGREWMEFDQVDAGYYAGLHRRAG